MADKAARNSGNSPRTEHALSIWQRLGEGSLRAECSCGWKGPKRTTYLVATRDHTKHRNEAALLAVYDEASEERS